MISSVKKYKGYYIARYQISNDGKGNYSGTQPDGNKVINTGSNNNYSINNIYDMAENVYEWTMEYYDNNRVYRGELSNISANYPALYRNANKASYGNGSIDFRMALYVK